MVQLVYVSVKWFFYQKKSSGDVLYKKYPRHATVIKRLRHRSFTVNFVKFLRTPVLKNTLTGAPVYLSPVEARNMRIVIRNMCYKWNTFAVKNIHLFCETFCKF